MILIHVLINYLLLMELKINKKHDYIIENITILYTISVIMIVFFQINNYKIILDINNFYINIDYFFNYIQFKDYILSLIDTLLLLLFVKSGINIINNKKSIFCYSMLTIYQLIKPVFIFYIYYNNYKLTISIISCGLSNAFL